MGNRRESSSSRLGKRTETINYEFPLINTNKIYDNIVSCPVKVDDNGVEHDATLFTGQVVFEIEKDDKDAYPTVRPRNDWCMAVAENNPGKEG